MTHCSNVYNSSILFIIPKIQGLDKSAALATEIKNICPSLEMNLVYWPEEEKTVFNVGSEFQSLLNSIFRNVYIFREKNVNEIDKVINTEICKNNAIVVCPHLTNTINTTYSQKIIRLFKSRGAKYWTFQKSIHDEGAGLTVRDTSNILSNLFYLKNRIKSFISPSSSSDIEPDIFLAYTPKIRNILRREGFRNVESVGYFLSYPTWQDLLKQNSRSTRTESVDVALFSRGQSHGQLDSKTVVTNSDFEKYLSEIVNVLHKYSQDFNKNTNLYLKPHPFQDFTSCENLLKNITHNKSINPYVYDGSPAQLALKVNLAITMYSSTAIDCLYQNVPVCEYFRPNPFFLQKHPAGSPFILAGAISAQNEKQLYDFIVQSQRLANKDFARKVDKYLGIVPEDRLKLKFLIEEALREHSNR
ncbi:MAG: hypothetical protein P8X65_08175 [Syntrophobacterales bacterium]